MTAGEREEGIDPRDPFQVDATGWATLWVGRGMAIRQGKMGGGGREGKGRS